MILNRKDIVKKAIHLGYPGRIPKFMFNGDKECSDVIEVVLEKWYQGEHKDITEWGFSWNKGNEDESSMGVPREYLLQDWDNFEFYIKNTLPDPYDKSRFDGLLGIDVKDRYLMGSLYLTGFTVMTFLRGFETLLLDMYEDPGKVEKVADIVFGFENEIIKQMPNYGFDAVSLYDDWGMQKSMMISPEMWRKFFKKRYEDQVNIAHNAGMDVFFHTCGYVAPIMQDLVDAGIDILNLGQADLNDLKNIRGNFNGKICFCQPINYQTTGISGTKEEIFAEAREILDTFSSEKGGLIAELFDYEKMGWKPKDPRNTEYQIKAFTEENQQD